MKRKRCALLLTAAVALSLTACGTNPARPSANGTDGSDDIVPDITSAPDDRNAAAGGRTIKLTLEGEEGTREITATLMDTPAAAEFAGHMPFTVEMHEHLDRQKEVYLDFSLSGENQTNSVHEYEIGDIVYWHPGPTYAMYYDHDGRTIAAGMEVIARMDQEGIDALGSYENDVEVTVSLLSE